MKKQKSGKAAKRMDRLTANLGHVCRLNWEWILAKKKKRAVETRWGHFGGFHGVKISERWSNSWTNHHKFLGVSDGIWVSNSGGYHRRTGQHPFGGADRVLPGWIQWGGGVVAEIFRNPYSVGGQNFSVNSSNRP